jgi:hypothetical protein
MASDMKKIDEGINRIRLYLDTQNKDDSFNKCKLIVFHVELLRYK